ncbi:MAG: hypothetical protein US86_C0007G0065 [Candidatus Daviesbacteria bacterium GW2011_GWA2_38_24]|uniref:Uncharacterized protein n=1 Tax=Candidatus Daviesbacteria bacterium GW2011_GWA2_38_24 TaxID=1618422 RepID=A0A0G0JSD3_9BACT|nr:MAG: hypothetical protein US86_C0007G0065 [Candidatus Daviesbacteria bacterium GW2011_GWA2_38_24]KKQ80997.1 MAG: hypothetical protein UT01_C0002G0024 [Candidatus Daviesbacteria bacterium GW2011_GWA1_38_7]OGE24407.1 MAG: hypothetical protein A2688_04640 [Candidatus Daviesbacteria bacterium RIFCSPHIGHO2_01_FULL_38_8]
METEAIRWQYVDKYTRRFLQTMYSEGMMRELEQKNPRLAEIGDAYFNQGQSINAIGGQYGLTRERIRQLKDNYIRNLHKLGDPYLQNLYPLEWIPKVVKGAPSLLFKRATDRSDLTAQIASMIKQRASREDILSLLGENPVKLHKVFQNLKRWGIDYSSISAGVDTKALLEKIQEEKNPTRLRELFRQVTRRAYVVGTTGENPVLIALSKIAREAGFRFKWLPTEFITAIDNEELRDDQVVPVGNLKYVRSGGKQKVSNVYFTKTELTERAQQRWFVEPELRKYL